MQALAAGIARAITSSEECGTKDRAARIAALCSSSSFRPRVERLADVNGPPGHVSVTLSGRMDGHKRLLLPPSDARVR